MSVIAEFSVAADDFVLGRALQRTSGLVIDLEKVIPTGDGFAPYVWVRGEGVEEIEGVLDGDGELRSHERVDEIDGGALYRVEWDRSVDSFVQTLVDHDAVLQDAGGDEESWRFQLRFPDSHALSEFHTACVDRSIDLAVDRLFNPIEPPSPQLLELTDPQWELIEKAYDEGFFEVPREVTLVDLAEEIGVSDQSINERMRRGLDTLVGATVKSGSGSGR